MRINGYGIWVVLLLLVSSGFANDGRDRYAGINANEMWLFPDTELDMTGYRVLEKDGPGGADGERTFRWAQPQAIALVRVAAYQTWKELGNATFPMAIFDLGSENGDTPIQFSQSGIPSGRHPGGSHDGGYNLDLGYFLSSVTGAHFSPDLAACTDHFKNSTQGKYSDANICNGPADRLDVERQSFFMLQLCKINRDLFDNALLEQIGMDWQIQKAIFNQFTSWITENKYGAKQEYLNDLKAICTADDFDGWSGYHHHHLHLRIRDISIYGTHREAFRSLMEMERECDRQIFAAKTPNEPQLRLRLRSYRMNRYVQAEIIGGIAENTPVRFRVKGGQWITPDPSDTTSIRAVLDLPQGLQYSPYRVEVEAEIGIPGSSPKIIKRTLTTPVLKPYLYIAVDPAQITSHLSRTTQLWQMKVIAPEPYRILITAVSFEIHYKKGNKIETKTHTGSMIDYSFNATDIEKPGPVQMIIAIVQISSRMTFKIPVYCAGE